MHHKLFCFVNLGEKNECLVVVVSHGKAVSDGSVSFSTCTAFFPLHASLDTFNRHCVDQIEMN